MGVKVSSHRLKLLFLFYAMFMNTHTYVYIPENYLHIWIWICTYLNLQIHQTLLGSCYFHVWILSFFALSVFLTAFPQASAFSSSALFASKVNLPHKEGCTGP